MQSNQLITNNKEINNKAKNSTKHIALAQVFLLFFSI